MSNKGYRFKYIAKILFVNVAAVVILFLLMEAVLRISHPEIKLSGTEQKLLLDSVYYDSPGLKPNSKGLSNGIIKTVDQYGFWKLGESPNNAREKILLLGDSVTMGIGVESDSTFAGRINSYLDNEVVMNSALIGYSSKDYYNVIRKLFIDNNNELDISSVYLFWCLNDIYSYHFIEGPGFGSGGILNRLISSLRKKSKLYHWLKNLFSDRSMEYYFYDKRYYENDNEQFLSAVNNISSIKAILEEHNVDFIMILLPYEYQLRVRDRRPQINLTEKLKVSKIVPYDLMDDIIKRVSDYKDLFLFGDGIHFSNSGHKIISEIILNKSIIP